MTSSPTLDPAGIDAGATSWILVSTALVMLMTPGLAFFYGGLVARKNLINTLMLSVACMGFVLVQWFLVGFSFSFAPGTKGFGSFEWAALNGWGLGPIDLAPKIPGYVFVMYQGAFAVITPALISGSVVGRMKFSAYIFFVLMWTTVVYDALAHWVWAPTGWLKELGALDFAGGTVVHIASGVSALVASVVLGKRFETDPMIPEDHHREERNIPSTILGAGLLWIGWNGFNAGSAVAADGLAGLALINTNLGAAGGMVGWFLMNLLFKEHRLKFAEAEAGAVVGLVGITPACGYVQPGWGLLIGVITAIFSWIATRFMQNKKWVDDTLDVFTCHGVGGIVGALLTGLFAQAEYGGANGSFYGEKMRFAYQLAAVVVAILYSAVCTAGLLLIVKYTIGVRVSTARELKGLDGSVPWSGVPMKPVNMSPIPSTPVRVEAV